MKTTASKLILALAASLATFAWASGPPATRPTSTATPCSTVAAPATLGADESATLRWLREEEKLARDTYRVFAQRWQDATFANIALSEQRHFDAIGLRLQNFAIADPAFADTGVFSSQELQDLYRSGLDQGSIDLAGALRVGAGIEEADIADLMAAMSQTTNSALLRTYSSLLAGSGNHLRAFVRHLQFLGIAYEPRTLEPELFDAIVNQ